MVDTLASVRIGALIADGLEHYINLPRKWPLFMPFYAVVYKCQHIGILAIITGRNSEERAIWREIEG
jgi:hypothetical protein